MSRWLVILFAALMGTGMSNAETPFDPAEPIIGNYSGFVTVAGMPQPVRIEIRARDPDDRRSAAIFWGNPRNFNCIGWTYGGPSDAGHIYYWYNQRGWCGEKVFRATTLVVRRTNSGGLLYELRNKNNRAIESYILQPE